MDIFVSKTLYMSCQARPGIEPVPSAPKASALPIELTWQTICNCSLCVFLSICLLVLVNCLLNAFAICVGVMTVFSLKVIVLLL